MFEDVMERNQLIEEEKGPLIAHAASVVKEVKQLLTDKAAYTEGEYYTKQFALSHPDYTHLIIEISEEGTLSFSCPPITGFGSKPLPVAESANYARLFIEAMDVWRKDLLDGQNKIFARIEAAKTLKID